MKKLVLAALMVSIGALLWPGCGGQECVSGRDCVCAGGTCDFECEGDGSGCAFKCNDGAACSFNCPGGACSMDCSSAKSCTMACVGNGCNVNCANTPSCAITACTADCPLSCGGAQTCSNSCDVTMNCPTAP